MKRVLCLMLSLVMLLSFASCMNGSDEEDDGRDVFDMFDEGYVPVTITTMVSYNYVDANDESKNVNLSGFYKTVTEPGRSIFTFTYERLATIEEQSDTLVKVIDGTIYRNGNEVSVDGDNFEDASALPGFNLSVDFKPENFDSYTIGENKKTIEAKVTGENIKKALGVELAANADGVVINITTNGAVITNVTLSYKTLNGADMFIATSYTYTPASLNWPN